MKRALLTAILCVSVVTGFFAQNGVWRGLNGIADGYTAKAVMFPTVFNSYNAGFNSGIILAEGIEDGIGTVFYTSNGGDTWNRVTSFRDPDYNAVTFGGLLGGTYSGGYMYLWGKEGALIRGSSASYWNFLFLPEEARDKDIVAGAFYPYDYTTGVVSDGTNIYYTENAATSWTTSKLPEGVSSINFIVYHSGTTFYAVGDNGQILQSTSSGYEWTFVSQRAGVNFTSITFIGENDALIGAVDSQDDSKGSIWLTNDGGVNAFTVHDTDGGAYGEFQYSYYESAWYTMDKSGTAIRTDDDGQSWTVVKQGSDQQGNNSFWITPQQVMYAIGEENGLEIYVPELNVDFSYYRAGEETFEYGFTNLTTGYVTSMRWEFDNGYPETSIARDPSYVMFNKGGEREVKLTVTSKAPGETETITKDKTIMLDVIADFDWEMIKIGSGDSYIHMGVAFPEGQNLIGITGAMQYTTGYNGTIWKTVDGGVNWYECEVELSDDIRNNKMWGISGISFPTMEVGYASGYGDFDYIGEGWDNIEYYPQLWKTTDGGETWKIVNMDAIRDKIEDSRFFDVHFWDENKGVVLNMSTLFYTEDGGETWEQSEYVNNTWNGITVELSMHAFCYADENTLYGVGMDQRMFKSEDGGKSWSLIHTLEYGAGNQLTGVAFRDADYGIAVGDDTHDGEIFLTRDGGVTWSNPDTGAAYLYDKVHFVNDTLVYIAGAPSALMKSEDGGLTWTSEKQPVTGEAFHGLSSSSTGVVFAVASQGIFKRYIPDMQAAFEATFDEDSTFVSFKNKSLGFITDYSWEVNGREVSTGADFELELTRPNTYVITLVASGPDPEDPSKPTIVMDKKTIEFELKEADDPGPGDGIHENMNVTEFRFFPNPVEDIFHCNFVLQTEADVKLVVSNVGGMEMLVKEYNNLPAGSHQISENINSWSKGVYLVQLLIDGKVATTIKVVK